MKKSLIPLLLLFALIVCCSEEKPIVTCQQRDIEWKVINKTSDILGVQLHTVQCVEGMSDFIGYSSLLGPQETHISMHSAYLRPTQTFQFRISKDSQYLNCCILQKVITDYNQQIVLLLTFDGTNYKMEFI